MKGHVRCVEGRLFRHDPQHDDPDLETDIGKCEECGGMGCDIPEGVYWSREAGNFYSEKTNRGMGLKFYEHWQERKDEFPEKSTSAAGIDLNLDKTVQVVGSLTERAKGGG